MVESQQHALSCSVRICRKQGSLGSFTEHISMWPPSKKSWGVGWLTIKLYMGNESDLIRNHSAKKKKPKVCSDRVLGVGVKTVGQASGTPWGCAEKLRLFLEKAFWLPAA